MIKVPLLISCVIAITSGAVIYTDGDNSAPTPTPCKYTDQMWGSEDLTSFYICLSPENNIAMEFPCPENTLFQITATQTGCLPLAKVADNCVYTAEVQPCTGANLRQPQTHLDPTKFYLCPYEGAEPVAISCPDGRAFVKQDGYLGCFEWAQFRSIRQCENA